MHIKFPMHIQSHVQDPNVCDLAGLVALMAAKAFGADSVAITDIKNDKSALTPLALEFGALSGWEKASPPVFIAHTGALGALILGDEAFAYCILLLSEYLLTSVPCQQPTALLPTTTRPAHNWHISCSLALAESLGADVCLNPQASATPAEVGEWLKASLPPYGPDIVIDCAGFQSTLQVSSR